VRVAPGRSHTSIFARRETHPRPQRYPHVGPSSHPGLVSERTMMSTTLTTMKAALALVLAQQAAGAGMHLAKLCRGETCTDSNYPILDYIESEDKCICRAHPCWEDNGMVHSCTTEGFPYLSFHYKQDRTLTCRCSQYSHYNSVHISHDLCPGHDCDNPEFPILDFDAVSDTCICRAHPCWDIDGVKHSCSEDKVLIYREDEPETPQGKAKGICECIPKMDAPSLRSEL